MSNEEVKKPKKIIPIVSDASQEEYVSLYQSEKKIYPRSTSGFSVIGVGLWFGLRS